MKKLLLLLPFILCINFSALFNSKVMGNNTSPVNGAIELSYDIIVGANIYILVDYSSSMKSMKEDLIMIITALYSQIYEYDQQQKYSYTFGMALFANTVFAEVEMELFTYESLKKAIKLIDMKETNPYTDFVPALEHAKDKLSHYTSTFSNKQNIILIISDGEYSSQKKIDDYPNEVKKAIDKLKSINCAIYMFALKDGKQHKQDKMLWEQWLDNTCYHIETNKNPVPSINDFIQQILPDHNIVTDKVDMTDKKSESDGALIKIFLIITAIIISFLIILRYYRKELRNNNSEKIQTLSDQNQVNKQITRHNTSQIKHNAHNNKNEITNMLEQARTHLQKKNYQQVNFLLTNIINELERTQYDYQEKAFETFTIMLEDILSNKNDMEFCQVTEKYLVKKESFMIRKGYATALKIKLIDDDKRIHRLISLLSYNENTGKKFFQQLSASGLKNNNSKPHQKKYIAIDTLIKLINDLSTINHTKLKMEIPQKYPNHEMEKYKIYDYDYNDKEGKFISDTVIFLIQNPLFPYNFQEKCTGRQLTLFDKFYTFLSDNFALTKYKDLNAIETHMNTILNESHVYFNELNLMEKNISRSIASNWKDKITDIKQNKNDYFDKNNVSVLLGPKITFNDDLENEFDFTFVIENNMKIPVYNISIQINIDVPLHPLDDNYTIFSILPNDYDRLLYQPDHYFTVQNYQVNLKMSYSHWFSNNNENESCFRYNTIETTKTESINPYYYLEQIETDLCLKSERIIDVLNIIENKLDKGNEIIHIFGLKGSGKSSLIKCMTTQKTIDSVYFVKMMSRNEFNDPCERIRYDLARDAEFLKAQIDSSRSPIAQNDKQDSMLLQQSDRHVITSFINYLKENNKKLVYIIDDIHEISTACLYDIACSARDLGFNLIFISDWFDIYRPNNYDKFPMPLISFDYHELYELINMSIPVLNYSDQAMSYLKNLTGGHPQLLFILFNHLHYNCTNKRDYNINLKTIQQAVNKELLHDPQKFTLFHEIFTGIPQKHQDFLASLVVNNIICPNTLSIKDNLEEQNHFLNDLKNMQIIKQNHSRWKLNIGFFKLWIEANKITPEKNLLKNNKIYQNEIMISKNHDVMFSYNLKDIEEVRQFKIKLEREKFSVFMAPEGIRTGAEWRKSIDKKIETCTICMIIVSTNLISEKYMFEEIIKIIDKYKEKIFPVIISKLSDNQRKRLEDDLYRYNLSRFQIADIYSDSGAFDKVVEDMKVMISNHNTND